MSATCCDRRQPCAARAFLTAALMLAAASAGAANFPVTGTITVNGNPGSLPAGGTFAGSAYDPVSGAIASGAFSFPDATISFDVAGIGTATVTYRLSQTNSSAGMVATDGVAALDTARMKLQVVSAWIGVIPIGVGTCVFQPINLDLGGTGSASGLDLDDPSFTIPPVGASDCGNYGSQINAGIAGSNNSVTMHMSGDFTPPSADTDTIFENGFDVASRAE